VLVAVDVAFAIETAVVENVDEEDTLEPGVLVEVEEDVEVAAGLLSELAEESVEVEADAEEDPDVAGALSLVCAEFAPVERAESESFATLAAAGVFVLDEGPSDEMEELASVGTASVEKAEMTLTPIPLWTSVAAAEAASAVATSSVLKKLPKVLVDRNTVSDVAELAICRFLAAIA
jgi:hypothetical protein